MKYFGLLLFLITIVIFPQKQNMDIQSKINEVKSKYAPDKRTAVFNVEGKHENKTIELSGETNKIEAKEELLNLIPKEYKVKDKITVLPAKELGDKIYGVIDLSVANIRSKPGDPEEMSNQGLLGFPVRILKEKDGWLLIQTPDNYIGWTDADGIASMTKEEANSWCTSKKVIYIKKYGSTFSKPDIKSFPVSDIVKGNILQFVEESNGYVKVKYPDGRIGYIPSEETQDFDSWAGSAKLTEEGLVNTARTFMGLPYLWGGTSYKGVDCSGFSKSVYYLNGIILPRDASQQVFAGDLVDTKDGFNNLKPGDLLFFGTKAKGTVKERVTHVAIYIGDGEFIHSSGRVKINSLDKEKENFSSYRLNGFIRAKRIINAKDTSLIKSVTNLFNKF
jgi:hypothetical protein